jgi:hypothetical protein
MFSYWMCYCYWLCCCYCCYWSCCCCCCSTSCQINDRTLMLLKRRTFYRTEIMNETWQSVGCHVQLLSHHSIMRDWYSFWPWQVGLTLNRWHLSWETTFYFWPKYVCFTTDRWSAVPSLSSSAPPVLFLLHLLLLHKHFWLTDKFSIIKLCIANLG